MCFSSIVFRHDCDGRRTPGTCPPARGSVLPGSAACSGPWATSLTVTGFSVLGLAIGQFLRSAVFAVITGIAWIIAVENIITRIVPGTAKGLPGTALDTVASGGGEGISYAHGLTVAAVYLAVAIAAAPVTFARRDVTA